MAEPPQIDRLRSYVPRPVLSHLLASGEITSPAAVRQRGVVLFVDISGFTPLTERLARRGAAGAESMAKILNAFFGATVDEIGEFGGDVIDFAGDALFALWAGDDDPSQRAKAAIDCALALHRSAAARTTEHVRLAIKATIGVGDVSLIRLGGEALSAVQTVMAGSAVLEATTIGLAAEPGDTLLSSRASASLDASHFAPAGVTKPDAPPVVRVIEGFQTGRRALPSPPPLEDGVTLAQWVAPAVLERVRRGQDEWLSEFRRLTSVFVKLVGLSYEDDAEIAEAHDAVVTIQPIVDSLGGRVQQFVVDDKGTVLLLEFGLPPRAHEDDAARAVQAALHIESALSELGIRTAIGITTGRAFCGPIGSDLRREYAVVGDVVNLAARLMQAGLDDVLCDATTVRAIPGLDYETLDPIRVKGKSNPVPVFRPYAAGDARPRRTAAPLQGRESESEAIEAALRGPRPIVLLEGEAGIGKSRLISELVERHERDGARVLFGAGHGIESATPLFAWRGVYQQILGLDEVPENRGARRRHMRRRLRSHPEWMELAPLLNPIVDLGLPETGVTGPMDDRQRAGRTRDLLLSLLVDATVPADTLLVLEDTHWFDSASWALLLRVVNETPGLRMLVTSRPTEADSPRSVAALGIAETAHLRLGPISASETAAIAAAALGSDDLGPALAQWIHARAEGHPFFAEELALALRDNGLVRVEPERATLVDPQRADELLPDTVQGVIVSRFDALDPDAQTVLRVASVLGREFARRDLVGALARVAGDVDLEHSLRSLAAAGMLGAGSRGDASTHRFKHAITRDVIYEAMLYAQRRRLHGAVGTWLEQETAMDGRERSIRLAHHLFMAVGPPGEDPRLEARAREKLGAWGRLALESGAFAEAESAYQRASELFERLPVDEREPGHELSMRLDQGVALFASRGYGSGEVHQHYERTVALAERLGAGDEPLFRALWGLWIARHFAHETEAALRLGDRMSALADDLDDDELRMQADHALWTTALMLPDYERCARHIERGVGLYAPSMHERHCAGFGGHDPGSCGHRALGIMAWVTGDPDRAVEHAERAVVLGRKHDATLGIAELALASVHRQRGDLDATEATARSIIARAEARGLSNPVPWARMYLGWVQGGRGEIEAGITVLESLHEQLGMIDPSYSSMLVELYVSAGRPSKGVALLDRLISLACEHGEGWYEPELHRLSGEFAALTGDVAARDEAFRRALDLASQQGAASFALRAASSAFRSTPQDPLARERLRNALTRIRGGAETRDPAMARALLAG
jgi:class 3 adenylate cyclase